MVKSCWKLILKLVGFMLILFSVCYMAKFIAEHIMFVGLLAVGMAILACVKPLPKERFKSEKAYENYKDEIENLKLLFMYMGVFFGTFIAVILTLALILAIG